jgi:hypothetical protein
MSDEVIVKNEGSTGAFAPHPEGSFIGVCVDVINLGDKLEQFQGNPPKIVPKVALVFQTIETNSDTGKPFELSVEKTVSFNERAGLRDFLGRWRGKTYTDAEAALGIPLHKLEGVNAMLIVEHKTSAAGRTYAKVSNIAPAAKGVSKLAPRNYTRAEYWEQRKADYAQAVQTHRVAAKTPAAVPLATALTSPDADDLPF